MRLLGALLTAGLLAVGVGCIGAEPTPPPTADVPATVEAVIKSTRVSETKVATAASSIAATRVVEYPVIVGKTGGACDRGYTNVAVSNEVRAEAQYGTVARWELEILLFNAEISLEETLQCAAGTGNPAVTYTLQIRTVDEISEWRERPRGGPGVMTKSTPESGEGPRPTKCVGVHPTLTRMGPKLVGPGASRDKNPRRTPAYPRPLPRHVHFHSHAIKKGGTGYQRPANEASCVTIPLLESPIP